MIEDQIKKLIKPAILEAKAYHVQKSEGLIKLDAMENPYIWTDELKSSWAEYMQKAELNRYPDASTSELREKLAAMFDLPEGIEMLFGNGSDELIQIIMLALNNQSNVIMAPEPGFVMYRLLGSLLQLDYVGVPLNNDFSLNLDDMLKAI
ncbi:MAG: aminotransferase class I/II-fold pyridoxal phosphate-dependent enzyme, partial [Gammaproteobacteria bacterium]